MNSSGSSTPDIGYYRLPPIITTEADREFLNEVNGYIDSELAKVNHLKEEERYLVFKTVFNKVIEHVTAYKPVLVEIKKEYEDTIETIKKGQREATFLQEKLKAMASEPSTLRNYRKRADELEERNAMIKKKNEQLQQELLQIKLLKEEKEKRPKTAETKERQLKKDSRMIPGLSIEESTDMKILQKKHETLDRQLKELSLSLRARFLPKTHKLQLKDSLDNKVAYRDQLLWQSQVYKARGQRLKIALEAAQAYNQMKPPHQTVGDAVTIAFQHASGILKADKEKTEGEQTDAAQASTFEDDDPNKEKEAEMMLEYIEKFNELFEDGLFEEAAVHAANSPKGILRTQATLAKFRDVRVKSKGRTPLLAFCDSIMSSVKAAGSKPNEALSMDCMEACLNENRLDLAYHWLSQDRLIQSVGLGHIISKHCSCPLPCKCGCQALAQSVFAKLKCHKEVVMTMLKQGKVQGALQYGRLRHCINDTNIKELLQEKCDQNFVNGLMEGDFNGNKIFTDLNFGSLLLTLVERNETELAVNLLESILNHAPPDGEANTVPLDLHAAVELDTSTTPDQWMVIMEALCTAGYQDIMYQLLAMTFVVDAVQKAWKTAHKEEEEKQGVATSNEPQVHEENDLQEGESSSEEDEKCEEYGKESSTGLSSRSRETTSIDRSSRETSPEVSKPRALQEAILKKKVYDRHDRVEEGSSPEGTPRKAPVKRRIVRIARNREPPINHSDEDVTDDREEEGVEEKRMDPGEPSCTDLDKMPGGGSPRVKFDEILSSERQDGDDPLENRSKEENISLENSEKVYLNNLNKAGKSVKKVKSAVKFDIKSDEENEKDTEDVIVKEPSLMNDDEMQLEGRESREENYQHSEMNPPEGKIVDHRAEETAGGGNIDGGIGNDKMAEDQINESIIDKVEKANAAIDEISELENGKNDD